MNNESKPSKANNDTFKNDESKGLNEDVHYENAKNNYENDEPVKEKNEKTGHIRSTSTNDDTNAAAVDH